jgi:hypothetical protein
MLLLDLRRFSYKKISSNQLGLLPSFTEGFSYKSVFLFL